MPAEIETQPNRSLFLFAMEMRGQVKSSRALSHAGKAGDGAQVSDLLRASIHTQLAKVKK